MTRWIALAALALGCDIGTLPPAGQIVLHVTTDAPLPAPGRVACANFGDEPALFDAVQIDVYYKPDATSDWTICEGCSRRFAVDCELADSGRASVGIVPPVGATGYVARVRMFRGDDLFNGDPRNDATLQAFVALPPTSTDGIVDVTVDLATDAIGTPAGSLDAPIAATIGTPTGGHVGSWPGARRIPCKDTPRGDEACVPGGAYWMGNPNVVAVHGAVDANLSRLVVLSPFFLDLTEVQVAPFRASKVAHPPSARFPSGDPVDEQATVGNCNYSSVPSGKEDYPVTCITWQSAREYCLKSGKDLPTEAQWEYVASALRNATYVWGEDAPTCEDAYFARTGLSRVPDDCVVSATVASAGPIGQGARDRITLGGVDIVDLAANAREWALDVFALQTDACWTPPLLHDPVCDTPSAQLPNASDLRPIRGGGFRDQPALLRAATRHFGHVDGEPVPGSATNDYTAYLDDYGTADPSGEIVGFRCARADP